MGAEPPSGIGMGAEPPSGMGAEPPSGMEAEPPSGIGTEPSPECQHDPTRSLDSYTALFFSLIKALDDGIQVYL